MVKLLAQESEVCTFVADGETSAAELRDAYQALSLAPPHRTLFDLTSATAERIDLDTMLDLARRVAEVGHRRLRLSRAALVCTRDPDYSMARALVTAVLLEGLSIRVAVFAEREAAKAWLDSSGAAA